MKLKQIRVLGLITIVTLAFVNIASSQDNYSYAYYARVNDSGYILLVNPSQPFSPAERISYPVPDGWLPPGRSATLSPDGTWIIFNMLSENLSEMLIQGFNIQTGEIRNLIEGFIHGRLETSIEWSPDGRYIALTGTLAGDGQSDLYLYSLENGTLTRLTNDSQNQRGVSWSDDSAQVATFTYCQDCSVEQSHLEIYTVIDGTLRFSTNLSSLVGEGSEACGAELSPTNRFIAFVSNCTFNITMIDLPSEVYIWDTEQATLRQITRFSEDPTEEYVVYYSKYQLHWTTDSTLLIGAEYLTRTAQRSKIVVYDLSNESLQFLSDQELSFWALNPRTNEVLLHTTAPILEESNIPSREVGQSEILSVDALTQAESLLDLRQQAVSIDTTHGFNPQWHPTENSIAYTLHEGDYATGSIESIFFLNLTTGNIEQHLVEIDGIERGITSFEIGWVMP